MIAERSNWSVICYGLGLAYLAAYQQFKLPPALPVLLNTYGYERTLAGGFMSVYAVAGLLLSVPLGRLVARAGPAGPVLAALGLTALGNGLALAAPANGWMVLASRGVEGVGFAVLAIAGPVLANAHASARHLPIVVGLTAAWIPIGQVVATALAPLTLGVEALGWRALWWAGIAGAGLMAVWTVRLGAVGAPRAARAGGGQAAPDLDRAATRARRRALILAGAVFMLWAGQYFAYMTWLPQYLVEVHGFSPAMAALGYIVPVAVLIPTNLATGLMLRAGAPVGVLLVAGLVAQTVVWILVPVTGGGVAGAISLIAYGLGAGVCPTCLFAMPSMVAGPRGRAATAFGTIMTGRNLGVLAGPVLLAQAFEIAGGWSVAGPLFGAVTGVALGLGLWLAFPLRSARYGTSR